MNRRCFEDFELRLAGLVGEASRRGSRETPPAFALVLSPSAVAMSCFSAGLALAQASMSCAAAASGLRLPISLLAAVFSAGLAIFAGGGEGCVELGCIEFCEGIERGEAGLRRGALCPAPA